MEKHESHETLYLSWSTRPRSERAVAQSRDHEQTMNKPSNGDFKLHIERKEFMALKAPWNVSSLAPVLPRGSPRRFVRIVPCERLKSGKHANLEISGGHSIR